MRKHGMLTSLLLMGALLGPGLVRVHAQWDVSNNASVTNPTPFGGERPDVGAIYGAAEFLFMTPSRSIGHQLIATRGFIDSDGSVTGTSGT